MRITTAQFGQETVQDRCWGKGKQVLNKVSNSLSSVHVQAGLLPNNLDGTSAILLRFPLMCIGVSGHACMAFRQSARAWMRCSATRDRLDASRTQLTVGELSLNNVIRFSRKLWQTPSMTSHSITNPAISRSELVSLPVGLVNEMISCLMSSGHSHQNTTGVHADNSPKTTLPMPWPDASIMPM